MDSQEIKELVVSAVVLAFVFAYQGIGNLSVLPTMFIVSLLSISIAFIFHELAHRTIARYYGCYARFQMWSFGLKVALLFAILTNGNFVFAAPGAVVIYPRIDLWGSQQPITKKESAIISLGGPGMNVLLAVVSFALIHLVAVGGIIQTILTYSMKINLWLALFNMIPIPPLDGSKIFGWNRKIWAVVFILLLVLFFVF